LSRAATSSIVIRIGDGQFFGGQDRRGFVARPGKVIAVVVERNVRVLRGVEAAALLVAEPLLHPAHDVFGNGREFRLNEGLEGVDVIRQQTRVVVEHLLEMRNEPALVDGVAMKSSGELIVDAAARHFSQRYRCGFLRRLIAGARRDVDEQVEYGGMGEFRLRAEASVAWIELADGALDELVDDAEGEAFAAC